MIRQSPPEPELSPNRKALAAISEARRILEEVVTSSESFDYRRAKEGLKELQRMIRDLGREEARIRNNCSRPDGAAPGASRIHTAKVLPFPLSTEGPLHSGSDGPE